MSHGLSLVCGTSYQSREALSKVSNCFLKATLDSDQVSEPLWNWVSSVGNRDDASPYFRAQL